MAGIFFFGWCLLMAYSFGLALASLMLLGEMVLWTAFMGLLAYGSHFMLWPLAALSTEQRPRITTRQDLSTLSARWHTSLWRLVLVAILLGIYNAVWLGTFSVYLFQHMSGPAVWPRWGAGVLFWVCVFGPNQLRMLMRCWEGYNGVSMEAKGNILHVSHWRKGRKREHRLGLAGLLVTTDKGEFRLKSGTNEVVLLGAQPADGARLAGILEALSQATQPAGDPMDVPIDLRRMAAGKRDRP